MAGRAVSFSPRWLGVVTLLVSAHGRTLPAQNPPVARGHVLVVTVMDSASRRPMPGAMVAVSVRAGAMRTDSAGTVTVHLVRAPRFVVEARSLGYTPARQDVTTAPGDTTFTQLLLSAAVLRLERVDVSGKSAEVVSPRLAGFEDRRRKNSGGSFITQDDLLRWGSVRMTDGLRRVPGVRITDSLGVRLAASSRFLKPKLSAQGVSGLTPCVMRVGVDGQIKEWGFAVDDMSIAEIHGVEVYPGPATIPAQFSGLRKDAFCGLVMIWTRAR